MFHFHDYGRKGFPSLPYLPASDPKPLKNISHDIKSLGPLFFFGSSEFLPTANREPSVEATVKRRGDQEL